MIRKESLRSSHAGCDASQSSRRECAAAPRFISGSLLRYTSAFWAVAFLVFFPVSHLESASSADAEASLLYQQAQAATREQRHEEAAALLSKALSLNPSSSGLRASLSQSYTDWAALLHERGQHAEALEKLKTAVATDPSNGPAWFLMGDLLYLRKGSFRESVQAWKEALKTAPDGIRPQILVRIQRAELDERLEHGASLYQTPHFEIKSLQPLPANQVESLSQILEEEYVSLSAELGVSPGKLGLILYQAGTFDRFSKGHEGIVGLYDGRIRIDAAQLGSRHERRVLNHEIAHAFLQEGFGSSLPVWVQEGYAQHREPPHELSAAEEEIRKSLETRQGWVPVDWLDRRFLQPGSDQDLDRAYLQARMAVAHLLEAYGPQAFHDFLTALGQAGPKGPEEAYRRVYTKEPWSRFSRGQWGGES